VKPERWKNIERLYHATRDRDSSERGKFLQQACAGDEELRLDVESLLAHESEAENSNLIGNDRISLRAPRGTHAEFQSSHRSLSASK
jgi:hypothetical protein